MLALQSSLSGVDHRYSHNSFVAVFLPRSQISVFLRVAGKGILVERVSAGTGKGGVLATGERVNYFLGL